MQQQQSYKTIKYSNLQLCISIIDPVTEHVLTSTLVMM